MAVGKAKGGGEGIICVPEFAERKKKKKRNTTKIIRKCVLNSRQRVVKKKYVGPGVGGTGKRKPCLLTAAEIHTLF